MKKQLSGSLGGFVNYFYRRHAELVSASRRVVGRIWDRHPETLRAASSASRRYQVCNNSNSMGFTLIELLVVVLIIGILAAVAVPQYQKAVEKARFATYRAAVNSVATAVEVFHLANGGWPSSLDELDIELPADLTTETSVGFGGICRSSNKMTCCFTFPRFDEGTSTGLAGSIKCGDLNLNLMYTILYANDVGQEQHTVICQAKDEEKKYQEICKAINGKSHHDASTQVPTPQGLLAYRSYYID